MIKTEEKPGCNINSFRPSIHPSIHACIYFFIPVNLVCVMETCAAGERCWRWTLLHPDRRTVPIWFRLCSVASQAPLLPPPPYHVFIFVFLLPVCSVSQLTCYCHHKSFYLSPGLLWPILCHFYSIPPRSHYPHVFYHTCHS